MKKRIIYLILAALLVTCLFSLSAYAGSSYDVEKVIGAKVTLGTYRVNVTRESQDMYKVTNQDIYIKALDYHFLFLM